MLINAAGPQTNIAQFYEGTFKAGFNHNDITVNQAWPLGADTAMSMGGYRITGKNQTGAPIEAAGFRTAVDVREGGNWKIRLLTAVPKPPPQPPK
jgi:ketosteroid isomerase-like protein